MSCCSAHHVRGDSSGDSQLGRVEDLLAHLRDAVVRTHAVFLAMARNVEVSFVAACDTHLWVVLADNGHDLLRDRAISVVSRVYGDEMGAELLCDEYCQ